MATIGDYIHFKSENYQNFGTYRSDYSNDGSPYSSAQSIYNQQKIRMLNNLKGSAINKGQLQKLGIQLTELIYGNPSLSNPTNEMFIKMRKTIERIYGEKFSNFGINWNEGMNVYPKLKKVSDPKFDIDRLQRYILKLNQAMARITTGMTKLSTNGSLAQMSETVESLEKELERIQQTNENYVKISDELLSEINRALVAETLPYSLAIGDIFENFLGVAQYTMSGKIDKVTDDLIKESIVGTTGKSKVQIDQSKFSKDFVNFTDSGNLYVNDYTTYKITGNETQDKLDVIFEWNGEKLNVTAKNYKLGDSSTTIHLVSGTSLLYLIQNEDPYFVNHWLNMIANTSRRNKKTFSIQDGHIAMKITIFAKALTGQGLGRMGEADTFILNWRSRKTVYVLSVTDIINTAARDIDNMATIKGYPPNVTNNWVGAKTYNFGNAMQRITNLIGQIYATKISVSLKQNAITATNTI